MTGFEVARRLKKSGCPAKIIFLTVHENIDFISAAFDLDAFGYVFKFASVRIWWLQLTGLAKAGTSVPRNYPWRSRRYVLTCELPGMDLSEYPSHALVSFPFRYFGEDRIVRYANLIRGMSCDQKLLQR